MKDSRDSKQEFRTLPALLRGLGYDFDEETSVGTELEDYAESYLYHDAYVSLTEWGEYESGEYVVLDADGVVMWNLEFPVTQQQLNDYLDELDARIGHMRIIGQLPDPDEDQPEPGTVEAVIASAFNVDAERVRDDLGTTWQCIASDVVGTSSNPIAYVRCGTRAVLGLDDQYIYVFRVDVDGDVLDAYSDGVAWEAEWPKDGDGALYDSFVAGLRDVVISGPQTAEPAPEE